MRRHSFYTVSLFHHCFCLRLFAEHVQIRYLQNTQRIDQKHRHEPTLLPATRRIPQTATLPVKRPDDHREDKKPKERTHRFQALIGEWVVHRYVYFLPSRNHFIKTVMPIIKHTTRFGWCVLWCARVNKVRTSLLEEGTPRTHACQGADRAETRRV